MPKLHHPALAAALLLAGGLSACGGGGDEAPRGSYFAIQGARTTNGVPVTICIDGVGYTDPATDAGRTIAANLASHFNIVGGYRAYSGQGASCREAFAVVDTLLGLPDYARIAEAAAGNGSAPPAPAAPPIACSGSGGSGTGGLQLYGTATHGPVTASARTTGSVTLDPGEIAYADASLAATATTGSLRARLRAVGASYGGGAISGHVMATYAILFTDGSDQLRNGASSNLVEQTLALTTPPPGSYCAVITLEQYDARSCTSADNFCIADWTQFPTALVFR